MKLERKNTLRVNIKGIPIGGGAPVVVQSMTNTDTADIKMTARQIIELSEAGSELVRITVNNEDSAKAVPYIVDAMMKENCETPLVGDFHYNGHRLLKDYPEMAKALAKYRINPGNVGFGNKQDKQFAEIIEQAITHDKPVRIGVNWGSLDQRILKQVMDENAGLEKPKSFEEVQNQALITSALGSAKFAEAVGLPEDKIVISCKVSEVQSLISVYRDLSSQSKYPLHLGLTEAGMGSKGIVSSSAALAVLLQEGIGDTIRISLTPEVGAPRTEEVTVAQELLQTMGLRSFFPLVTACPGCGRTTSTFFQKLAGEIQKFLKTRMHIWADNNPGAEDMKVAVMGCIVNGPGESKHANIGISLPGTGESPVAPIFEDGVKTKTLRGDNIIEEFKECIEDYVARKYSSDNTNENDYNILSKEVV